MPFYCFPSPRKELWRPSRNKSSNWNELDPFELFFLFVFPRFQELKKKKANDKSFKFLSLQLLCYFSWNYITFFFLWQNSPILRWFQDFFFLKIFLLLSFWSCVKLLVISKDLGTRLVFKSEGSERAVVKKENKRILWHRLSKVTNDCLIWKLVNDMSGIEGKETINGYNINKRCWFIFKGISEIVTVKKKTLFVVFLNLRMIFFEMIVLFPSSLLLI